MESGEPVRLLEGRYRLTEVIGRGGMGNVWRAWDGLLNRDVAVKEIFLPPYYGDEERETACRRAVREAQMAARLRHPNVVGVYDIIEEDGRPWIVMELLPYPSLRDIVTEAGPLDPVRAARLGLEVLAALRAAHGEGIVHRDVKPANILVCSGGRGVLTDFGIARAVDSPAVTSSGVLLGSPSYIAPEHARGWQAGPAVDLWGLGASLYTAVEGRPPFEREGALASLTAVLADEPDPAVYAGPLWPVISGLLRKDPGERLGTAETERMLCQVAVGATAIPAPTAAPSIRHRAALAACLAVTAAAATAIAVVLSDPPGHLAASMTASTPRSVQSLPAGTGHPSARPALAKAPTAPAAPGAKRAVLPVGHNRLTSAVGTSRSHPGPAPQRDAPPPPGPGPYSAPPRHGHRPRHGPNPSG